VTPELESRMKQMFAELDESLPGAHFTTEVMSALLRPRRRERLLSFSAILAALVFLWLSFPTFQAGLRIVAGFPHVFLPVARESLAALAQSPVVCIYGMALGGYALLWLVLRLREARLP
jgi:hypothetical protein